MHAVIGCQACSIVIADVRNNIMLSIDAKQAVLLDTADVLSLAVKYAVLLLLICCYWLSSVQYRYC